MSKKPFYYDLIGCEFKFMARGENNKYDCLGLIYELYNRLNLKFPYHISIIDRKLRAAVLEENKKLFIKIDEPEPYCIVGFRVAGIVNHIGMVLENCKTFIHIARKRTVCIERLNSPMYKKRIDGYYRLLKK